MSFPGELVENSTDNYNVFGDDNVFEDDDVFENDDSVELRQKDCDASTPPQRIRRVSDVIDSLGDSPVHRTFMEAMDDRRRSDPLKFVPVRNDSGSQRHSDGYIPTARRKSGSDDGYGSCITINPQAEYSTFTPNQKKPVNDTIDARVDPLNDTIDAQPFHCATSAVAPEAKMPVHMDSEEYNMNHEKRGKAVIFNHDTFTMPGISSRKGSDVDVDYLLKTFALLGFEVDVQHNLTRAQLTDYVNNLSKEDFSNSDCLCIAVLTHGLGSNFLLAHDTPYTFEELWAPFTGDRCLTLAGKPKLFFIQACRGDQLDPGVKLVSSSPRTEVDSSPSSYKIPSRADFLFAYSSVEGYYSWRNPEDGTWFIQCLCEELQLNAGHMDLQKILTRVQRKVALEHESYNDMIPWQHEQKQVPSVVSMLIRDIYFKPK